MTEWDIQAWFWQGLPVGQHYKIAMSVFWGLIWGGGGSVAVVRRRLQMCSNVWALLKAVSCSWERSGSQVGSGQSNRAEGGAERSSGGVWHVGDQPRSLKRVREARLV